MAQTNWSLKHTHTLNSEQWTRHLDGLLFNSNDSVKILRSVEIPYFPINFRLCSITKTSICCVSKAYSKIQLKNPEWRISESFLSEIRRRSSLIVSALEAFGICMLTDWQENRHVLNAGNEIKLVFMSNSRVRSFEEAFVTFINSGTMRGTFLKIML